MKYAHFIKLTNSNKNETNNLFIYEWDGESEIFIPLIVKPIIENGNNYLYVKFISHKNLYCKYKVEKEIEELYNLIISSKKYDGFSLAQFTIDQFNGSININIYNDNYINKISLFNTQSLFFIFDIFNINIKNDYFYKLLLEDGDCLN